MQVVVKLVQKNKNVFSWNDGVEHEPKKSPNEQHLFLLNLFSLYISLCISLSLSLCPILHKHTLSLYFSLYLSPTLLYLSNFHLFSIFPFFILFFFVFLFLFLSLLPPPPTVDYFKQILCTF